MYCFCLFVTLFMLDLIFRSYVFIWKLAMKIKGIVCTFCKHSPFFQKKIDTFFSSGIMVSCKVHYRVVHVPPPNWSCGNENKHHALDDTRRHTVGRPGATVSLVRTVTKNNLHRGDYDINGIDDVMNGVDNSIWS